MHQGSLTLSDFIIRLKLISILELSFIVVNVICNWWRSCHWEMWLSAGFDVGLNGTMAVPVSFCIASSSSYCFGLLFWIIDFYLLFSAFDQKITFFWARAPTSLNQNCVPLSTRLRSEGLQNNKFELHEHQGWLSCNQILCCPGLKLSTAILLTLLHWSTFYANNAKTLDGPGVKWLVQHWPFVRRTQNGSKCSETEFQGWSCISLALCISELHPPRNGP